MELPILIVNNQDTAIVFDNFIFEYRCSSQSYCFAIDPAQPDYLISRPYTKPASYGFTFYNVKLNSIWKELIEKNIDISVEGNEAEVKFLGRFFTGRITALCYHEEKLIIDEIFFAGPRG